MELATVRLLRDLNRHFYEQHAEAFADSRPRLAPGVRRVLDLIPSGARVLEAGCGDGKVGRWLAGNTNITLYLGLDSSAAMLERARRLSGGWRVESEATRLSSPSTLHFELADLTSPDWTHILPHHPFDWILAFALFHHLPGYANRARLLRELADRLAPGGMFAMSNWQFTRSERLRGRIRPWSQLNLAEGDVEPNDYLLSWERKGRSGLRYVHVLDEAEARQMAEEAGLNLVEVFGSDGVTGDLADYALMRTNVKVE